MAYFKIGETDYSPYVEQLTVNKSANFSAQTNAAGNTVVDYINSKRKITVGIIPLNDTIMSQLLGDIAPFNVSISFRDPRTNALYEGLACIIPEEEVDYYTIQSNNVMYNAMTLEFTEL